MHTGKIVKFGGKIRLEADAEQLRELGIESKVYRPGHLGLFSLVVWRTDAEKAGLLLAGGMHEALAKVRAKENVDKEDCGCGEEKMV